MPIGLLSPASGEYNIHCPKCRKKFSTKLIAGWTHWKCPKCSQNAKFLLATVRAKRGRNDWVSGTFLGREYSLRYIDSSGEGLLHFRSESREDIELRSRDVVIAVFIKKKRYQAKPFGIYNYSINRYFKIH